MMFALSPLRNRAAGHGDASASSTTNNPSSASQADLELGIRQPQSSAAEGGASSRRANNVSVLSTASTQHGDAADGLAPSSAAGASGGTQRSGGGNGGHGREASGRSVRSALSAFSLGNLRERDRNHTLHQVEASVERQRERDEAAATAAAAGSNNTQGWRAALAAANPSRVVQAFQNGGISNPPRAGIANANANANAPPQPPTTDAAVATARAAVVAERKKQATKREKDEAATLFGPTLSNYFGSGSSSSGAVNGGNLANPGSNGVAAAHPGLASPDPNAIAALPGTPTSPVPGGSAAGPRRPRLGSRGRARGASLSGLSMQSLNEQYLAQQSQSQGAEFLASSPTLAASPALGGLLFDTETPGLKDAPQEQQPSLLMADGIELETLARWVDRTVGLHLPSPTSAEAQKDSTETSLGGSALPSSATPSGTMPAGAAKAADGAFSPMGVVCTTLQSYVNLKRNAIKLSAIDSGSSAPVDHLANGSTIRADDPLSSDASVSSSMPPPTHSLQLEYDCAAPNASVQVFLRASRKHGSWQSYVPPTPTSAAEEGAAQRRLAQRGPPPHALGFPVHGAIVKRGFGAKTKASLALRLELFAPPSEKNKAAAGGLADGIEHQLTLHATREEVDDPATAADARLADAEAAAAAEPTADGMAGNTSARTSEPLSREARADKAAREKVERETLKMAIVMEALDEDGVPLREPNLQTTYLRVSSLPARGPDGMPFPDGRRTWSLQVEGQEAEIGPHRFQLQELYGLSSKPPPVQVHAHEATEQAEEGAVAGDTGAGLDENPMPVITDVDATGSECLICLSDPPTTLLLPCTHGLCLQCAIQLRESVKGIRESERRRGKNPKRKYACPVCRRAYTSMLHIATADEKNAAQNAAL